MTNEEPRSEARLRLLMAAAGHDLRNRLHSMLMNVDLLGTDSQRPAEVLRTEIGRIDELLDQYLRLIGWHEAERQEISLSGSLEAAVRRARACAEGIEIRVDRAEVAWLVDEAAVARALDELLDNAARAVGDKGSITLSVRPCPHHVEVVVCDDGEGIAADRLQALLTLGSSGWGRAGLGLSVVRQVARAHGGGLTLRSAGPGRGTEAVMRLL